MSRPLRLAHLSDLHLGARPAHTRAARALVRSLLDEAVDHVVVTGDVTHGGRLEEHALWLETFGPLLEAGMVTVVPGNHDRAGDDVAERLSDELAVSVDSREGLFMVCVDSTAPHNRSTLRSHGALCERMLAAVDDALALAPRGCTRAVLLHHHVLPLPAEGVGEWFSEQFGWPLAAELPLGRELLRRVRGRVDLVLHGHKHVPRESVLEGERPLRIANAGCSTVLGAYRVFRHAEGFVLPGTWVHAAPPCPPPLLSRWLSGAPGPVPGAMASSMPVSLET